MGTNPTSRVKATSEHDCQQHECTMRKGRCWGGGDRERIQLANIIVGRKSGLKKNKNEGVVKRNKTKKKPKTTEKAKQKKKPKKQKPTQQPKNLRKSSSHCCSLLKQ